jgi:predicted transcriptional regulator
MTLTFLQQHWALAGSSVVATAVLMFVVWRAWLDSPRGRLRVARRRLRAKRLEAQRQRKALQSLSSRLDHLESKANSVKPRLLREAAEAVQDAEALLKIADAKGLRGYDSAGVNPTSEEIRWHQPHS